MKKPIQTLLALLCALCLALGTPCAYAQATQADDKTTYVFALGLGRPDKGDRDRANMLYKWQASEMFVQSYLRTQVDPAQDRVMVSFLSNTPSFKDGFDLSQGYDEVAKLMAEHGYDTVKDYSDVLRAFADGMRKRLPQGGRTEIWLITSRDAIVMNLDKIDRNKTIDAMDDLLKHAGVTLHFVYMRAESDAPVQPGENQIRMDEYLLSRYPGQVVVHEMPASKEGLTLLPEEYLQSADVMLARAEALPAPEAVEGSSGRDWQFVYNHKPWDETGDAMLLISSDVELRGGEGALVMTGANQETVKASAVRMETTGYLYAEDLPEGSYVVKLQLGNKRGENDALVMQPYVVVERGSESRKLTAAPANAPEQWYREDQTLTLTVPLFSSNMPAMEQWEAWALVDGREVLCRIDHSEASDAMRWTVRLPGTELQLGQSVIVPQLRLKDQAGVTLAAEPIQVQITNRPPQIAGGYEGVYDVFYDLPAVCAPNANVQTVDLNRLFSDDDSDELLYVMDSCTEVTADGSERVLYVSPDAPAVDDAAFAAYIDGAQLVYTPKAEAGNVKINLIATDGNEGVSETVTLSFQHHSLSQTLSNGLVFVPQPSYLLSEGENGTWKGTLGHANAITFGLQDPSQYALVVKALEVCGLNGGVLSGDIVYGIEMNRHSGEDTSVVKSEARAVQLTKTESDIGFTINLSPDGEPTQVGTHYVVRFKEKGAALTNGLVLDQILLAPDYIVDVENSAPYAIAQDQTLEATAKDFLQTPLAIDLGSLMSGEGMLLKDWFGDNDLGELRYELSVESLAQQVTVWQNGAQLAPRENAVYDVDGSAEMSVRLQGSGEYALVFTVRDSEHFAQRRILVETKSQTAQILLMALIAVATIAVIVALVLFIIWQRKPSFGSLCIGLYITDDEASAIQPQPTLSLRAHGKRAVSMISLALAARQPIPDQSAAQWLESISLAPTHKGLGDLKFSGRHADTTVVCNGTTRPASGSLHLSESEYEVRIRTKGCTVVVTVARN